ncbi:DsbA family oxidoreductase [Spirochaeta cellobiosiphila]|uniref:DsbA family oxidoreductase n=1 Tax=Spirochaeta cellobiosiphila TaxID=504483 RepID=UPI000410D1C6|nr:DsbA family oxidoreductase [Spirochaeta cellobiosiphila]
MKIDIWSDHVCPFCYIGKRRLEKALENTKLDEDVEIEYHSFELSPQSPKISTENIHQALARKYGMSEEQAKSSNEQVGNMAREEGLNYDFDNMKYTNTFDAHRLCHLAKSQGKDKELIELLMNHYFTKGSLISDHDILITLAKKVGLEEDQVRLVLETDRYAKEVREDEYLAQTHHIGGVPYFIIDDSYTISGAQPLEVFTETLKKAGSSSKLPKLKLF